MLAFYCTLTSVLGVNFRGIKLENYTRLKEHTPWVTKFDVIHEWNHCIREKYCCAWNMLGTNAIFNTWKCSIWNNVCCSGYNIDNNWTYSAEMVGGYNLKLKLMIKIILSIRLATIFTVNKYQYRRSHSEYSVMFYVLNLLMKDLALIML